MARCAQVTCFLKWYDNNDTSFIGCFLRQYMWLIVNLCAYFCVILFCYERNFKGFDVFRFQYFWKNGFKQPMENLSYQKRDKYHGVLIPLVRLGMLLTTSVLMLNIFLYCFSCCFTSCFIIVNNYVDWRSIEHSSCC